MEYYSIPSHLRATVLAEIERQRQRITFFTEDADEHICSTTLISLLTNFLAIIDKANYGTSGVILSQSVISQQGEIFEPFDRKFTDPSLRDIFRLFRRVHIKNKKPFPIFIT